MRKERRILDRLNKTNLNKQNANRQNLHSAANYYPPSLQNTRPHFCLEGVHCRKEHKYIATLLVMDPDFITDLETRKTIFKINLLAGAAAVLYASVKKVFGRKT